VATLTVKLYMHIELVHRVNQEWEVRQRKKKTFRQTSLYFDLMLNLLPLQIIEETLPALQELKREGLVRNIGFSGLPLAIYPAILDRYPPPPPTIRDALSQVFLLLINQLAKI